VDDRRDAESGVLDEMALDLVGERRGLSGGSCWHRSSSSRGRARSPATVSADRRRAVAVGDLEDPALPSWASFSSIVIRASRSATRSATDRDGSR
jgi:hypothetical protein